MERSDSSASEPHRRRGVKREPQGTIADAEMPAAPEGSVIAFAKQEPKNAAEGPKGAAEEPKGEAEEAGKMRPREGASHKTRIKEDGSLCSL